MFQPDIFESDQHFLDMTHLKNFELSELGNLRDDDYENKSGTEMDTISGDDQDPNQRPKKKPYHRHTQHQIQEMEA